MLLLLAQSSSKSLGGPQGWATEETSVFERKPFYPRVVIHIDLFLLGVVKAHNLWLRDFVLRSNSMQGMDMAQIKKLTAYLFICLFRFIRL